MISSGHQSRHTPGAEKKEKNTNKKRVKINKYRYVENVTAAVDFRTIRAREEKNIALRSPTARMMNFPRDDTPLAKSKDIILLFPRRVLDEYRKIKKIYRFSWVERMKIYHDL